MSAVSLGVVAWSAMGVMVKLVSPDAQNVALWRLWMSVSLMAVIGPAAGVR